MLAIKVNGGFLDLGDASASFTMINPIFDRENIERTFSYPLTINNTPKNKALLKYSPRLDGPTTTTIDGAELYIDGVLYEKGVIRIKNPSRYKTKIAFENKTLADWKTMGKTSIQNLSLPQTVPFNFCVEYHFRVEITGVHHPDSIVRIGINGKAYWALTEHMEDLVDIINEDYPGLCTFFSSEYLVYMEIGLKCTDPSLPIFVDTVPQMDFATIGIQHGFNLIDGPWDRTTGAMSDAWNEYLTNVHADPDTHVFPVSKNPALYGGDNPTYKSHVNYTDTSNSWPANSGFNAIQGTPSWEYALIPCMFLHKAIQAIADQIIDINVEGDFFEDDELATLVLYNTRTLDRTEVERLLEDEEEDTFNVHNWQFDLSDHLPDETVQQFLLDLMSTFGFFLHIVNGKLKFDFIKNVLNKPAIDWTEKAEPDYTQSFQDPEQFNFDYDRQGFDEELVEGQLQRINNAEDANEKLSGFFTCYMLEETLGFPPRRWIVPFAQEEGTSVPFGIANDSSKRILFYRGLQNDNQGNTYPFATHSNTDLDGNVIGNYTLEWDGVRGLYETWWKEITTLLMSTRVVTKTVRLNIQDILEMKKWDNPNRRIWHNEGVLEGVIKQVKFRAGRNGIGLAELEIYSKI